MSNAFFFLIFLFFHPVSLKKVSVHPLRDSIRTETYKNKIVIIYQVTPKETYYSIARRYKISPAAIMDINKETPDLKIGSVIRVPIDMPAPTPSVVIKPSKTFKEVSEAGQGMWMEDNDLNQARTVALHKYAPVGTMITVTNPMTKKSVLLKVVGRFALTHETRNSIVVIPKSAAELIGAIDQRFRVEITFRY